MSETITRTEAVSKIVKLSKEMLINENIDFSLLNINEEDAYEMVANNVLTQMYETPEDYRDTVMRASITKIKDEKHFLKINFGSEINIF